MDTTRLSTKGQVVLPKAVRDAKNWPSGTELEVVPHPEGVLLRTPAVAKRYTLDDLAGCLKYDGPPVSIADMNTAIDLAMTERWERKSR
ncbi:MAG: AbrB/MazE/SpoVT family DNA-binding domain-containing protein [Phreatobacter sp.]|uniref:AbrB/MazE/SpoVT family DNA-binding domain-containing protein n=1 Tax=Phreatobacter sp. TaxID=1966341 RepID=UPI002736C6A9|nr:AbrB/MazE/SpoVT family DNA-binding domain-containing protein [Phreatobacter sp.]MDP2802022.1 AbrB/MazE/SpoVT family DNA-binding domain-containing protein [Phreatobacter sp.]